MTRKTPKTLTPKRRFPAFRDAPGWDEERLGDQGDFLSSLTGKTAKDFDTGDASFIPYMNVFSNPFIDASDLRSVDVAEGETQNAVAKGDVFFTVSSETQDEAGMSSVLLEEIENTYLNSFCALFRFDEGKSPNPGYLGYLLRSKVIRDHMGRGSQGATRYNISKGTFRDTPLLIPDPAEQQKIADCLGSLDDWIAAAGRKLAALRDHKRGLMQQLFPQPNQSQPQQRFPEFRDTGEWTHSKLGPMTTKVGSGITPRGGDKNYLKVGRIFIRSQNVGWGVLILDDVAYIDDETHRSFDATEIHERDVLLNITGASIGRSAVADSRAKGGNVNQHVCIIRTKPNQLQPFLLNQYLISEYGQTQIDSFQAGGNRQGLNFGQIRSFVIPLPPTKDEQQKIAACLTALDTQITAQAGQIEALQQHKRGLMQQLFPSPGEAGGVAS